MGGLGPGIGGLEILVIGLLALIVVGPKDLPVMLRKLGRALGKARTMANDFRASFDEMARQSELDELRNEVEALRRNQMVPLGVEAESTFREIDADLNRPITAPAPEPQPLLTGPEEFADPRPPEASAPPRAKTAKTSRASSKPNAAATKPAARTASSAKPGSKPKATSVGKPKVARKKAIDL